ncbi:MAG: general secretion pathway protein GspK [Bdellovibrionales bacterium]|nr:general secretion pathway protein GspK [Bdellovibrionales bacterium]
MFFYKKMKQKSGAALLILLALSALIIPLLQGTWLDTQNYYQIRRYSVDQMKARFNAQAGIDIALMRLSMFKGAEKSLPTKGKSQFASLLNQFWTFPFNWPLTLNEDLLESEKEALEELKQKSFVEGSYFVFIEPEDGRFDLNNLSSPFPFLQEFTYEALFRLLSLSIEEDERLRDKYDESDIREILDNISDEIDTDNESQSGGLESLLKKGIAILNRSFISIEELSKVQGIDKSLYQILEPYTTVYGSWSLNINYVKDKTLSALGFPLDVVEQVMLRISADSQDYRPFTGEDDFCQFSQQQGYDICGGLKENYGHLDMLNFNFPVAFRIKSLGEYRSQKVELEALLYDLSSTSLQYQKILSLEKKRRKANLNNPGKTDQTESPKPKQNELKIDYTYYKSLVIMYMKENSLDD